ncbi:hypothetical protein HY522_11165 [bacterium]|nr:hypothetical protein [bacterium]
MTPSALVVFGMSVLTACGSPASVDHRPPPAPQSNASAAPASRVEITAVYAGTLRAKPPSRVTTDAHVCGGQIEDESLVVGPKGELAHVFVELIPSVPVPAPSEFHAAPLDQKACRFIPHVGLARPGRPVRVFNSDGILHTISISPVAGLFRRQSRAQPASVKELTLQIEKSGIAKIVCDVHYWMTAYLVVTDNPYAAVTDTMGTSRIEGVAPGTYTVRTWHESLNAPRDIQSDDRSLPGTPPKLVVSAESHRLNFLW